MNPSELPVNLWYKEGLRFTCQPGCVRCCGGDPGDVFVTAEEITALAAHLKMPQTEFEDRHVRHYSSGKMSLMERRNGDCVLLNHTGCSVYEARPQQCRDYPFWPEVLESQQTWIRETRRCPGLNEGTLHPAASIIDLLKKQQPN